MYQTILVSYNLIVSLLTNLLIYHKIPRTLIGWYQMIYNIEDILRDVKLGDLIIRRYKTYKT